jgi:hypothetical protein
MVQIAESARNLLFDYFVGEIFGGLPATAQTALLQTAVLPKMRLSWVEELTGSAEAGRILVDFHRRGFFVLKREDSDADYEYHPLFRDFLLTEARKTQTEEALSALLIRAAEVLVKARQAEDAVPLYLEADDYPALVALLSTLAPAMLAQGRHQTLAQWLGEIPNAVLQRNGWLLFWLGHARLPHDPQDARRQFEAAWACFDAEGDPVGLYLSWAVIINSFYMGWGGFSSLKLWLDRFEQMQSRHPCPESPDIVAQVCSAGISVHYHVLDYPRLSAWADQARHLLER